ncbi:MAG: prolipoprotein diacylglyceryl transferase [Acidimicrobiales bacterium]
MLAVLASIPSPSSGAISIGPLQLRAYGLMIALGVVAAVWLTGRRLEAKGVGAREDAAAIAMWGVPAGVIGARLYHVVTDLDRFRDDPLKAFRLWEGGLGIWGGIAAGVVAGVWAARRRGITMTDAMGAAAPALPLAQAIGRLGNWWNQELFGGPTDLPWGLEIDPAKRPAAYADVATFHPTFLYEGLWNLALCALLIWVDRRWAPRPARLFALYVAGYTFGRFWIERLRIDPATTVLGLRINEWVSGGVFLVAVAFLVISGRRSAVAGGAGSGGAPGTAEPDEDLEVGPVAVPQLGVDEGPLERDEGRTDTTE